MGGEICVHIKGHSASPRQAMISIFELAFLVIKQTSESHQPEKAIDPDRLCGSIAALTPWRKRHPVPRQLNVKTLLHS
jgi:hypothetical protein